MHDNVPCEFAVIRLVPKVEREEFLNVGVLLYARQRKFLGMRYVLNEARIKAFAPDLDLAEIEAYLKAWEAMIQGSPQGGKIGELDLANRFRWLSASRSTLLQCSPTHPGLCGDAEALLEDFFQRFVL